MGFLDDMFNFGAPAGSEQKQSEGLLDSIFNFGAPKGGSSGGASSGWSTSVSGLFSSGHRESEPPRLSGMFGYAEPILPSHTQARGYGGQYFGTQSEADKSTLIKGSVKDPDTGYVGTPEEIYDRYIAEGRDPKDLLKRYRRRQR